MKLRIEKPIYGGAGLARIGEGPLAGKAVFVPLALPGEWVEAHVVAEHRGFANAEIDAVLEASSSRATAPCPYFGNCGGCQYQHASYAAQVQMKSAILRETLERAKVPTAEPLPIIPLSGEPWGYRNRVRLHIDPATGSLGYRQRRSHTLIDVDQCPIAAPLLERAIAAWNRLAAKGSLRDAGDEVEFFTSGAQESLLFSMHSARPLRDPSKSLERIAQAIQSEIPEASGAALFATDRPRQPGKLTARWGEQALTYAVAGQEYRVSLGSFFQVNRFLIEPLLNLVTSGRSGALAWDLYAGVGLFANALATGFDKVVAVESAPSSSGDLQANLPAGPHQAVRSTTFDFLRRRKRGERPDLVVVDPPRAGLGAEITLLLAEVAAPQLVYVSCDPATLARDLHALVQSGYTLESLHLVDLFPQTFHLESVCVLKLR